MWRELTEADVLGVLNAAETAAYKTAVIGAGQDVMADLITQVTNHCRGYIGDNPANKLAEGITLPERVHRPALHLLRVDLLTRLDIEVSEDRRKANSEAVRFFERVADGKVQIEQPDGVTDDSGAQPTIDTVQSRERQFTRETQSGL